MILATSSKRYSHLFSIIIINYYYCFCGTGILRRGAVLAMSVLLGRTWWSGSLVGGGGSDGIRFIQVPPLHSLISSSGSKSRSAE